MGGTVGIDLIIFSRDREKALLSTMQRMSNSTLRVLVFHNSQSKLRDELIPSNCTYIHSPGMKYGERASIARSYIASNFCVISSDDDGIINSALLEMENWLICNPVYCSVGGISIGAFPYGGRISASVAYNEMKEYSLDGDDLNERLRNHLLFGSGNKPPRAGLYRLFRRDTMDKLLELFGELSDISTPYVYEVSAEIVSAWAGPTKYIDQLYWIRNWHAEEISKRDWNRHISFYEWWNNQKYSSEKKKFLKVLVDKLSLDQDFVDELVSEYVIRWQEFFQSARKSRSKAYPKNARSIWQKIKMKLFPYRSPKKIENLLSEEFDFLTSLEQQEICKVAQSMFLETRIDNF